MTIFRNLGSGLLLAALAAGCGTDPGEVLEDAASLSAVTLASPGQIARGEVVENSYIVAFRAPTGTGSRRYANFLAESRDQYAWLDEAFTPDPRVTDLRYITAVDLANPRVPGASPDFDAPPMLRLAFDEGRLDEVSAALAKVDFVNGDGAASLLQEWEKGGAIWYAEPNYVNYLMDGPYTSATVDAYKQAAAHWHDSIKLGKALEKLAGAQLGTVAAPVIAVLDSGADVKHPALADHIWVNEAPGQSGCPNDVNGCDTTVAKKKVLGSGNVNPYLTTDYNQACPAADPTNADAAGEAGVCAHGTHVSGIIAASPQSGQQAGGVCPVCKIMVIKIIKSIKGRGAASDDAILGGFKYLTLFGSTSKVVRVANSSFGKYVRARSVALLVSVLKKKPIELLVVGAAGNEDSMVRTYPAALNDAIAVASVMSDGNTIQGANGPVSRKDGKAGYSNFGPWVDVSAPGGEGPNIGDGCGPSTGASCIASSVPGGTIEGKKGTSMAAPVVTGVAGLVLSIDPTRGFQRLRDSIINTADPRIYDEGVFDGINRRAYYPKVAGENVRRPLLGSGVVDAEAALEGTAKTGLTNPSLHRVNRNCSVVGGAGPERAAWPVLLLLVLPLALARVRDR